MSVVLGSAIVGGARPVVIAGPCSVEPGYVEHAVALAGIGVDALRACLFKPRTHPDSFQGLGTDGLPLLREARRRTGLPMVSEVLSAEDAEGLADDVDAFQVGARNMQNTRLLEALGEMGRPVILKRGIAATIDEWIAASEYLRRRGNDQVILCERGIRTFEPRTRNTLDLSAVVVARELTDLPILVDPSHAAGRREWVPPLARAALAVGADGLLLEAHPEPDAAWSDADQTIGLDALKVLVAEVAVVARGSDVRSVKGGRALIDQLDTEIVRLMGRRLAAAMDIQQLKRIDCRPPIDHARESEVIARYLGLGGVGVEIAKALLAAARGPQT